MLQKFLRSLRNLTSKTKKQESKQNSEPIQDKPDKSLKGNPLKKSFSNKSETIGQHSSHHRPQESLKSQKKDQFTPNKNSKAADKHQWGLSEFQVLPSEDKTRFHDLDLPIEIMHGIFDLGFQYCSPIQAAILPESLKGTDVTGRAQTGTGKSAAFLITILTQLIQKPKMIRRPGTPRALIIVPTRELAVQVKNDAILLAKYCQCNVIAVFGGMDYQKQKKLLSEKPVDIVVATPGRLLDFKQQGEVHLGKVEILVLDEADQMLDMGFIPDVRKIIHSTPPKTRRQTMLFGATLTSEVSRLASQWTRDTFIVEIEPEQVAVDTVEQIVYLTTAKEKFSVLYNVITQEKPERIIIFCNRRDQTRELSDRLRSHKIKCAFLSGEVGQKKRISTLENFRAGKNRVLVATDVAGRGIHVEGISHVVNYTLPMDPEDYVHRIGRTGRAGVPGISISFATESESFQIPPISEFIGRELPCVYPEDRLLVAPPPPQKDHKPSSYTRPRKPRPKRNQSSRHSNKHLRQTKKKI